MTDIFTRYVIGCGIAGSVLGCMNLAWEFKQKQLKNNPGHIVHPFVPIPVDYIFASIPRAVGCFITGMIQSVLAPATATGYVLNMFACWIFPNLFIKGL